MFFVNTEVLLIINNSKRRHRVSEDALIRCSGHDSAILREVENHCDWFPFNLSMWIYIMETFFAIYPVPIRNNNVLQQNNFSSKTELLKFC